MNRPRQPGDRPDPNRRAYRHLDNGRSPIGPDHETDQETILLRGPAPLLTAVNYLLGYRPPEPSLVVVGVQDRRLVLTARIDLPAITEPPLIDGLSHAWSMFTGPLQASDAHAVAVIAYTDQTWNAALREFTDSSPLPVLDLLRVHDGQWWSLDCPGLDPDGCGQPGCTPDGAPLIDQTDVAAPMIAAGASVPGTRADLAAGLRPGPAEAIRAVAARLSVQPTLGRGTLYQAISEAHDARADGPKPIPTGQAAVLLSGLADPLVRDACLAWTDDAAWWLWHDLIATAPPGWVASVATTIAVTAYQRGNGVMASIAAEHALTDVPDYGLALLIRASLERAVPAEAIRTLITEGLAAHPLTTRHDDTDK